MHEFGLMADLLTKIENIATEQNAETVKRIDVWLGAMAHISPEHFREHFVDGTKGTMVEGAELDIELSKDIEHPQAQQILLRSIDVG